jgi:CheY-like chemotaxis protein
LRRRILIVDDEEHVREVAAMSLELTAGWDIRQAESGAAALQAAIAWRPEAILLDVMMPDLDGPSAFALLQADARTAGIPVIFLTAKVQTADRLRFASLGVQGVLAKPFDPLTLAERVSEILSWT